MLCTEERMSSVDRGDSVPLLYVEGGVSLFYKGSRESVPLLYVKWAYSLDRVYIECLLYTEDRVSLLLLYTGERVYSLHRGEIVLLLYVEEAGYFSVQKRERECLL